MIQKQRISGRMLSTFFLILGSPITSQAIDLDLGYTLYILPTDF